MAHPALMESRRPAPRIPSSRRRLRQATPRSRWKTATAKCITSSLRRPTAHFRSGAAARRRSHGPGLRCRGFPVPGAQPPACAAVGVLRLRSALDRRSQARAGSRDPRPNALSTCNCCLMDGRNCAIMPNGSSRCANRGARGCKPFRMIRSAL